MRNKSYYYFGRNCIMNTGNVQGVYAGMVLFMVAMIYLIRNVGQFAIFLFVLVACFVFTIGLKAAVLEGDRSLNEKDIADIALNCVIAVFSIVGTTMAFISQRPLISRAFENTVGYKWISLFNGLSDIMNGVFQGTANQDYSIIATQLFDDNLDMNTLNSVASKFSGVSVNPNLVDIKPLQTVIKNKHSVSEATLTSLAAIVAFYISYLPVWKPWIRA